MGTHTMASLRTTPLLLLLLSLTLTAAKPQFRRLFDDLSEDLTKREGRQYDPVQELADAVVEEVQENIKEELEEIVGEAVEEAVEAVVESELVQDAEDRIENAAEAVVEAAVETPEAAEAAEGAVDTEAAEDADETAKSVVETVADAMGLLTETLSTALIVPGTTASSFLTFILLHFVVLPTWGLVGKWPLLAALQALGIAGGLAGALGAASWDSRLIGTHTVTVTIYILATGIVTVIVILRFIVKLRFTGTCALRSEKNKSQK